MNILVIGSGGREHALAWKISQSPLAGQVYVAPGNAGTALEPRLVNVNIPVTAIDDLIQFAVTNAIQLTIVGPELPLVMGLGDAFRAAGLQCLGPSQAAAQLEGSKAFTKEFLHRHNIPTAAYAIFTELDLALDYLQQATFPIVIKADGLAAGKGVIIVNDFADAATAVRRLLGGEYLEGAGRKIVIEEFLAGEEVSFIALVDGVNILPLASSQDHKAIGDGDTGPNTGGMGAYSPAPVLTPKIHSKVMQTIMLPTVRGMAAEGYPYQGFLYAGLMIDSKGNPKVLEFNCRCGDPETQPIVLRLESDLVELSLATLAGKLDQITAKWSSQVALGVVLAAGGYPGAYARGQIITGLPPDPNPVYKVFHAGTALQNGRVVTNGGRVLCVTALGATVAEARRIAYEVAASIQWPNYYYRKDIGYRAMRYLKTS
ncbi:phosphoribosylamine--glycine ligase [Achromatium sp. WMS2]|nr:phosphoribosylamine--glycine ligase [Achromatium sp. WMS2]